MREIINIIDAHFWYIFQNFEILALNRIDFLKKCTLLVPIKSFFVSQQKMVIKHFFSLMLDYDPT